MYVPKTLNLTRSGSQSCDDFEDASGAILTESGAFMTRSPSDWTLPKDFESFSMSCNDSAIQKIWSPILQSSDIQKECDAFAVTTVVNSEVVEQLNTSSQKEYKVNFVYRDWLKRLSRQMTKAAHYFCSRNCALKVL